MLFTGLGRAVLGKTVPSVSSTALGLRPRAVLETEGTVFPNCWFSHYVTKLQTSELLILLKCYFHDE